MSRLSKAFKKVTHSIEKKLRPITKIAAVAAAAYYIPGASAIIGQSLMRSKVSQSTETQPYSNAPLIVSGGYPGGVVSGQVYTPSGSPSQYYEYAGSGLGGGSAIQGGGEVSPSSGISPMILLAIGGAFLFLIAIVAIRR